MYKFDSCAQGGSSWGSHNHFDSGVTNSASDFDQKGSRSGTTISSDWMFSKMDSGCSGWRFLRGDSFHKDTIYFSLPDFHSLIRRRILLSQCCIYRSSKISLRGIRWKWLLSSLTSCSKLLLFLSLISTVWGDVLDSGSPLKKLDNLKGKVEAMELKCINLQEKLVVLQEEVNNANSLREAEKLNASPSILVAHVTKLKGYLRDAKSLRSISIN